MNKALFLPVGFYVVYILIGMLIGVGSTYADVIVFVGIGVFIALLLGVNILLAMRAPPKGVKDELFAFRQLFSENKIYGGENK